MRVFLSHSSADKSIAAKLRRSLEERGLSFNDPGESLSLHYLAQRRPIEEAIRSSDAILLLLSSLRKADFTQQLTWRLVLEAVWADPTKPLIPILLHDAELPAFVRSGASGDRVQAIRIREAKDLGPAVQAILRTLGIKPPGDRLGGRRLYRSTNGARPKVVESYPVVTDEDRVQRLERLSAIKQYAEQLKH